MAWYEHHQLSAALPAALHTAFFLDESVTADCRSHAACICQAQPLVAMEGIHDDKLFNFFDSMMSDRRRSTHAAPLTTWVVRQSAEIVHWPVPQARIQCHQAHEHMRREGVGARSSLMCRDVGNLCEPSRPLPHSAFTPGVCTSSTRTPLNYNLIHPDQVLDFLPSPHDEFLDRCGTTLDIRVHTISLSLFAKFSVPRCKDLQSVASTSIWIST